LVAEEKTMAARGVVGVSNYYSTVIDTSHATINREAKANDTLFVFPNNIAMEVMNLRQGVVNNIVMVSTLLQKNGSNSKNTISVRVLMIPAGCSVRKKLFAGKIEDRCPY
jgi:hypothetical protein